MRVSEGGLLNTGRNIEVIGHLLKSRWATTMVVVANMIHIRIFYKHNQQTLQQNQRSRAPIEGESWTMGWLTLPRGSGILET